MDMSWNKVYKPISNPTNNGTMWYPKLKNDQLVLHTKAALGNEPQGGLQGKPSAFLGIKPLRIYHIPKIGTIWLTRNYLWIWWKTGETFMKRRFINWQNWPMLTPFIGFQSTAVYFCATRSPCFPLWALHLKFSELRSNNFSNTLGRGGEVRYPYKIMYIYI